MEVKNREDFKKEMTLKQMSKAVLTSIKPERCGKIANREEIIEVRKTRPKIDTPFKCYIYCTYDGYNHLYDIGIYMHSKPYFTITNHNKSSYVPSGFLNSKVIGEFICDSIFDYWYPYYYNETNCAVSLTKLGCLSIDEVWKYGKGKTLYGWHISDLKIYDEPKELSEFRTPCKYSDNYPCRFCNKSKYYSDNILYCDNTLKRPPQSWCYVEEI